MAATVETEKTRAEIVFEQYLSQRALRFEHEAVSGRKKPDYLIHGPSGDCIVEVKQIEDPDSRPSKGFNPDRPVRAKIKSARRQLGEYKQTALQPSRIQRIHVRSLRPCHHALCGLRPRLSAGRARLQEDRPEPIVFEDRIPQADANPHHVTRWEGSGRTGAPSQVARCASMDLGPRTGLR